MRESGKAARIYLLENTLSAMSLALPCPQISLFDETTDLRTRRPKSK